MTTSPNYFPVEERTTRKYTATVQDENDAAIPGSSLTTMTLTLYDVDSGAIINSRNDVDVKSLVDGSGLLTWVMDPLDNQILDANKDQEAHVALFEFTYAAGAKRGQHAVRILVTNSAKVP